MLTKTGFDLGNKYKALKGTPVMRGLSKAEFAGVGPMSLAFEGLNVASGNTSVGGAVGGSIGGALAYEGTSRALAPAASKLTKALTPLVSKMPKAGIWKGLSKLPGWAGAIGKVGAGLTMAGIVGGKARKIGDTYVPIWQKKQLSDAQLNPYQDQMLQQARLAGRSGLQQLNNTNLMPVQG